jgi:hypothetical protein
MCITQHDPENPLSEYVLAHDAVAFGISLRAALSAPASALPNALQQPVQGRFECWVRFRGFWREAAARSDLEATLAALPWPDRRRLGLILESARVGANSEAVREAVEVMLGLAAEVWARAPPPHERNSGTAPA